MKRKIFLTKKIRSANPNVRNLTRKYQNINTLWFLFILFSAVHFELVYTIYCMWIGVCNINVKKASWQLFSQYNIFNFVLYITEYLEKKINRTDTQRINYAIIL